MQLGYLSIIKRTLTPGILTGYTWCFFARRINIDWIHCKERQISVGKVTSSPLLPRRPSARAAAAFAVNVAIQIQSCLEKSVTPGGLCDLAPNNCGEIRWLMSTSRKYRELWGSNQVVATVTFLSSFGLLCFKHFLVGEYLSFYVDLWNMGFRGKNILG